MNHRFRAMGCEVVVGTDDIGAVEAITRLFAERDRMFSRFIDGSELNRVNAQAGRPVRVTRAFASMVSLALDAAHDTGGLVDPTLGRALEEAGYDSDFADITRDSPAQLVPRAGTWEAVRLAGCALLFPADVRLDLNGVVKSKTVDDAVALLREPGFVSAGGDLATRGATVVSLPAGGTVRLVRGGLATSGTDRKRWVRGGVLHHHLIDPRTGTPSRSRWIQVTACGASCVAADIAAKAAFLLDDEGPDWLDERRIPGRFVDVDGETHENRAWKTALTRSVQCT